MLQPTDWAVPRISLIVPAVGKGSSSVLYHRESCEKQLGKFPLCLLTIPPTLLGVLQGSPGTASHLHWVYSTSFTRSTPESTIHTITILYNLHQEVVQARHPMGAVTTPQGSPSNGSRPQLRLRGAEQDCASQHNTYLRARGPGTGAASAARCPRSHQS